MYLTIYVNLVADNSPWYIRLSSTKPTSNMSGLFPQRIGSPWLLTESNIYLRVTYHCVCIFQLQCSFSLVRIRMWPKLLVNITKILSISKLLYYEWSSVTTTWLISPQIWMTPSLHSLHRTMSYGGSFVDSNPTCVIPLSMSICMQYI